MAFIIIAASIVAYIVYKKFTESIINLPEDETFELYIRTNADFYDVKDSLYKYDLIKDKKVFELLAEEKNYIDNIKPGRYIIKSDMSANRLINLLKSGSQTPIKLTFNNIRHIEELAEQASKYIEANEQDLLDKLLNPEIAEKYGFNKLNFISMFLPNTYEFYWNTSANQFLDRMKKEYDKFWNSERLEKAEKLELTPKEVSVLASIVQEETNKRDEMDIVAGLYLNRLERNMPLQADPTVRFAIGDFSIKRILYSHLEYESPFNTYIYSGLPPGPISMPEPITIDKVLNPKDHKYLFMCAKADGSGYHAFARNSREHSQNARAYHRYLNSLK